MVTMEAEGQDVTELVTGRTKINTDPDMVVVCVVNEALEEDIVKVFVVD